jgi:rubrerythrin
MNAQTRENVITALHGEAFAHARYRVFAESARRSGEDDLANLFEGIATVEMQEHFVELAELLELAGCGSDNIRTAIQDENAEVEETYRRFAAQARSAGDEAVADSFDEIREDERVHLDALEAALERLEVPA